MCDKGDSGHFGDGGNVLPSDESQLKHIFNDRPGHLPDTPKNRQALLDVANDDSCYLGVDGYGNEWHASTDGSGSQTWTSSRGGVIQNGGRNHPPRRWDDETGLNNNPFRR